MALKIFITGGSGFIGRNLNEQLGGSYEIFSPTSRELDLLDSNRIENYLKSHKFDVVIHAGTWNAVRISTKDRTKVFRNNLLMFFNLARCSNFFGKMLYYGSGAEYHRHKLPPKVSEDFFSTIVPEDDYGLSKYIMAKHAQQADNIYDLVIFGVYGKYEDPRIRFISNACCRTIFDLPITIKQNVFFDYLYIDDLVNTTKWFIENDFHEKRINVSTGKSIDLFSLAEIVLKVSGKNLDIEVENKGLGIEYSGNNAKLINIMLKDKFTDYVDAITELYNWYSLEKNKEIIRNLSI